MDSVTEIVDLIDYSGIGDGRPDITRRCADIARRWGVLDAAAWSRVEVRVRVAIVREVMQHTSDPAVLAACQGVIDAIEGRGDTTDARVGAMSVARDVRVPRIARMCARIAWAASARDPIDGVAAVSTMAGMVAAERAGSGGAPTICRLIDAVLDALEGEIAQAEVGR